jgi:hypothetical protein
MTSATRDARSWRPATDEELAWFKVGGILPTYPKPLDLSCAVHAFTYGVTHALESLYFPLYEIRPRSIDGQLYLAVVPSGLADRDIEARIRNVSDRTIRFRDILGGWRRDVGPQVEEDVERMASFPPSGASGEELHEAWLRFRRVRANQWFAPTRAVICPTALLKMGIGEGRSDEALSAVEEVREVVIRRGTDVFDAAIDRLGGQLVRAGCLAAADDVLWLEFDEVSAALERGSGAYQETVANRKTRASAETNDGPATVGAPLDPGDRRLFLLPEIFDLLGVASPLSALVR